MEEKIFFSEGNVLVTNARVEASGVTYPMSGIVRVYHAKHLGLLAHFAVYFAVAFVALATVCFLFGLIVDEPMLGGYVPSFAAVALVLGFIWKNSKQVHSVQLTTASGTNDSVVSKDEAFVGRVVSAINNAIVARG